MTCLPGMMSLITSGAEASAGETENFARNSPYTGGAGPPGVVPAAPVDGDRNAGRLAEDSEDR